MKNFKFIYLLAAVVGVLTFASCQHPYADWAPGAKDSNMGVYFPSTKGFEVTAEDTTVDIAVARGNADAAASVSLRYQALNGAGEATELFTVPSKVEFAAGETEATLTVAFDGSQLTIGEKYTVTIKLDEAEASTYAISEATFSIVVPEPWTSMGQGIYFDEILCEMFQEADAFRGLGAYVEFEQHDLDPNRIRVKNPFAAEVLGSMWGGVPSWVTFLATSDYYLEFNITDPNNVLCGSIVELSDDQGNTRKACMFPFYINLDAAYDLYCMIYFEETPIVLKDGIIKFPQGTVELAAFADGQYLGYFTNTANANGYMQYYLPGTEFVNYDMAAAYGGMYVSADGQTAKAIFNFALGGDVASYKFAFAEGDVTADPSAVAEAIVAGSEELVIFEGTPETTSWEIELVGGEYTLVAVPYTAEGEARLQNTLAYAFNFPGVGQAAQPQAAVKGASIARSFAKANLAL